MYCLSILFESKSLEAIKSEIPVGDYDDFFIFEADFLNPLSAIVPELAG